MGSIAFGVLIIGILMLFYLFSRSYRKECISNGMGGSTTATKIKLLEMREAIRAGVTWPVTIESAEGILKGETINVSIGGAFICCQKLPALEKTFRLTLNPPQHQPLKAIAEVVWSNFNVPESEIVHRGIGIRFSEISHEDRQFIAKTVKDHHLKSLEMREAKRAGVTWPVTIESAEGILKGETVNVSIGGAFICCQKLPALEKTFRLTINPPQHQPLKTTAEVVWSNFNVPESEIVKRGMGIRFLGISYEDRQFIAKIIAVHHG